MCEIGRHFERYWKGKLSAINLGLLRGGHLTGRTMSSF